MIMPQSLHRRFQRGFTLIELLAVIAILGILAAIAIPAIGDVQQSLDVTELDAMARDIFIAAQNRATVMLAEGSLAGDDPQMAVQPSDFPSDVTWPATDTPYRYAAHSSNEAGAQRADRLLPSGSIDSTLFGNNYIIEYNQRTGEIYGVFYYQASNSAVPQYSANAFNQFRSDRGARRNTKIGYFGGAASALVETDRTNAPRFTLLNEEELCFRLFSPATNGTTYTMVIQNGEDATTALSWTLSRGLGGTWALTPAAGNPITQLAVRTGAGDYIDVVLDSLETGRHFRELFSQSADFLPGDDLTVTLCAQRPDADGKSYLESDNISARANSLYASLAAREQGGSNIAVAYGRHLQNLDAGVSGHIDSANGLYIAQTRDIDWSYWNERSIPFVAIYGVSKNENSARVGNSIHVFDGQGNIIQNLTITPNSHTVKFSYSTGDDTLCAGLFACTHNAELKNIHIVKGALNIPLTQTITDSHLAAGSFAGMLFDGSVTNCSASLERFIISAATTGTFRRYTGGFAGATSGVSISRCYANTAELRLDGVSANDRVAGFIGNGEGGGIANCYAMGDMALYGTNTNIVQARVGGFVNFGVSNKQFQTIPSIENAYTALTYYAKRLVTDPAIPTALPLCAFSYVDATNTYAPAEVPLAERSTSYYMRTDHIGAGLDTGTPKTYAEMTDAAFAALLGSAWTDAASAPTGTTVPFSADKSAPCPFPILKEAAAPNPNIIHYGDWPDEPPETLLAYYELYDDGKYGFYVGDGVTDVINTLRRPSFGDLVGTASFANALSVVKDGYAILRDSTGVTLPALSLEYQEYSGNATQPYKSVTAQLTPLAQVFAVDNEDGTQTPQELKTYHAYPFTDGTNSSTEDIMGSSLAQLAEGQTAFSYEALSYYHRFIASGWKLFCNPAFGKLTKTDADLAPTRTLPDDPGTVSIRTARQLYQLGLARQSGYWDMAFQQEGDIDFRITPMTNIDPATQKIARSASSTPCAPIGRFVEDITGTLSPAATPFAGSYTGSMSVQGTTIENRIVGMRILVNARNDAGRYVGMFGICEGMGGPLGNAELRDVRLVDPTVTSATPNMINAGILAGSVANASITGCYAYQDANFQLTLGALGDCSLQCSHGVTIATDPTAGVGGLIGYAASCNITDSLVSPTLLRYDGTLGNSLYPTYVGGFIGNADILATISNCYANTKIMRVDGDYSTTRGSGSYVGGFAGKNTQSIQCCYALGTISSYTSQSGNKVAGFVVDTVNGTVENCYTACQYTGREDTMNNGADTALTEGYGFVYTGLTKCTNCAYMSTANQTPNANIHRSSMLGMATLNGDNHVSGGCWTDCSGTHHAVTHPYKTGGSMTYPFTYLTSMPHYGDWPEDSGQLPNVLLAYYEKSGSDYHFDISYFPLPEGRNSTLGGDYTVDEDGYALLCKSSYITTDITTDEFKVLYGPAAANGTAPESYTLHKVNDRVSSALVSLDDNREVAGYFIFPLKMLDAQSYKGPNWTDIARSTRYADAKTKDASGNATSFSYYYHLGVGPTTATKYTEAAVSGFYFNPLFAKTAQFSSPGVPASDPGVVSIRTARQLYDLATGLRTKGLSGGVETEGAGDSLYWGYRQSGADHTGATRAELNYQQDRAIDFSSAYGTGFAMQPIGRAAALPFDTAYNGQSFVITSTGLTAAPAAHAGLFGYVDNTYVTANNLTNILFVSDTGSRSISGVDANYSLGGLVGVNSGAQIRNCMVAGFAITGDMAGSGYTGGFVGQNESGEILNCAADNYTTTHGGANTGGSVTGSKVGGFVGYNGNARIQDCYALARIPVDPAAIGGVSGGGFVWEYPTGSAASSFLRCYCVSYDGNQLAAFYRHNAQPGATCFQLARNATSAGDLTYTQLSDLVWTGWAKATAANTHPYDNKTGAYPFPAIVAAQGGMVHYGSWPMHSNNPDNVSSDGILLPEE